MIRRFPFLYALAHKLPGLDRAFAALIAGAQLGAQAAHVGNFLFLYGLSNLSIGDLFADADVHNRTR